MSDLKNLPNIIATDNTFAPIAVDPNRRAGGFGYLSIRNSCFSYPVQDGAPRPYMAKDMRSPASHLDVLIVDVSDNAKTFYDTKYGETSDLKGPACESYDGKYPVDGVRTPQADSCAMCLKNQWGSAGKGKACKDTRYLSIIPLQDFEVFEDQFGAPLCLKLPVTSLKNFDALLDRIQSQGQGRIPVQALIYRLSFDHKANWPLLTFSISPENNGAASADHLATIKRWYGTELNNKMVRKMDASTVPKPNPLPAPSNKAIAHEEQPTSEVRSARVKTAPKAAEPEATDDGFVDF